MRKHIDRKVENPDVNNDVEIVHGHGINNKYCTYFFLFITRYIHRNSQYILLVLFYY